MMTEIRKNGDNVYLNFRGLNVLEDVVECVYFAIISIDSVPASILGLLHI